MRLSRSLVVLLFTACLGYYAVLANAAPSRRALAETSSSLADLGRMLPRLSLPATAVLTAREGLSELRRVVQASPLMHDTRPAEDVARKAHAALWAELDSVLRTGRDEIHPDPAGLLPGQD
ncbi:hypothetical protein [Desulfovibrio sp. TomC]|uniref:hypothetical protein n=1 Tax=Desulfovibrio sp. TomC TaxID=1562888 RepID=UPI0005733161|nr:hypothetical protein [Desulfovibrio sp. TomC]KHK00742.1 hypothetical protein NY78_3881 [Desulfovibrio sp. TomC]